MLRPGRRLLLKCFSLPTAARFPQQTGNPCLAQATTSTVASRKKAVRHVQPHVASPRQPARITRSTATDPGKCRTIQDLRLTWLVDLRIEDRQLRGQDGKASAAHLAEGFAGDTADLTIEFCLGHGNIPLDGGDKKRRRPDQHKLIWPKYESDLGAATRATDWQPPANALRARPFPPPAHRCGARMGRVAAR